MGLARRSLPCLAARKAPMSGAVARHLRWGMKSRRQAEGVTGRPVVRRISRSRQIVKVSLYLAGALLFVAGVALAEKAKSINIPKDSVLPGGQQLKAGSYQVDVNEAANQVTFKKGNKVVATAGGNIVVKVENNTCSEARFGEKHNKQQLEELRFGGEQRSILPVGGGS
jgi:hypothetical protein